MMQEQQLTTFLQSLGKNNPVEFKNLIKNLYEYQWGDQEPEEMMEHLKNSIRHDFGLIEILNQNLSQPKKIQVLDKVTFSNLLNFAYDNLLEQIPEKKEEIKEWLFQSIQLSQQNIDRFYFYSKEEFIEYYLRGLNVVAEQGLISREFLEVLKEVMNQFKEQTQQRQEIVENNNYQVSQESSFHETELQEPKNDLKNQAIKIETDEQILEVIEQELEKEEFEIFLKIFYLYSKNIISYFEFVDLAEEFLIKLDKNVCQILQSTIESRERSLLLRNPYNLKELEKNLSFDRTMKYNPSYKQIVQKNMQYVHQTSKLINKEYFSVASGNEAGGEENARAHIKNSSEEELLRLEDELHEFDNILQRFKVVRGFIDKILNGKISQQRIQTYLKKIKNIKILNLLYGKKADQLVELIQESPFQLLPLVEKRLIQREETLLEEKQSFYRPKWQKIMSTHYYKGLDTKSNSIKIREKKKLINKNIIMELRKSEENPNKQFNKIKIVETIPKYIGPKKETKYFDGSTHHSLIWNPLVAFHLEDEEVMSDVVQFLISYVKQSKGQHQMEYQQCLKIINGFLTNYFQISNTKIQELNEEDQNENKFFTNLNLENLFNLGEEIKEAEQMQPKQVTFSYADKLTIKINENKYNELLENIKNNFVTESKKDKSNQLERDFQDKINSNDSQEEYFQEMQIKKQKVQKNRIFFASHQFYLFYRYFVYIYERFKYAKDTSQEIVGDSKLYELFKKLLLLNLNSVIENVLYEDSMRAIFYAHSGVLLNFDKIFQNIFKIYKEDEFANFVMSLNKHLFEEGQQEDIQEEILFAKSCFKLNTIICQSNKSSKNSHLTSFSNNYNVTRNEFLKFEFISDQKIFIVHKVKSIFHQKDKEIPKSYPKNYEAFLKYHEKQIAKPVTIISEIEFPDQFFESNKISYLFPKSQNVLSFLCSEQEDVFFNLSKVEIDEEQRKEILKEKKELFLKFRKNN